MANQRIFPCSPSSDTSDAPTAFLIAATASVLLSFAPTASVGTFSAAVNSLSDMAAIGTMLMTMRTASSADKNFFAICFASLIFLCAAFLLGGHYYPPDRHGARLSGICPLCVCPQNSPAPAVAPSPPALTYQEGRASCRRRRYRHGRGRGGQPFGKSAFAHGLRPS